MDEWTDEMDELIDEWTDEMDELIDEWTDEVDGRNGRVNGRIGRDRWTRRPI
jgi:hypothetical protein